MHRALIRQRSKCPFEVRLGPDVMRGRIRCGLRSARFYHQVPELVGLEQAPERLFCNRLHDGGGGCHERARRRRAPERGGVRVVVA